jgi:hypothetical protein
LERDARVHPRRSGCPPLLARAGTVEILIIDSQHRRERRGQEPGADIARHLMLHGVNVKTASIFWRSGRGSGFAVASSSLRPICSLWARIATPNCRSGYLAGSHGPFCMRRTSRF